MSAGVVSRQTHAIQTLVNELKMGCHQNASYERLFGARQTFAMPGATVKS